MRMFRKAVWYATHPLSLVLSEVGIRLDQRWLFNLGGGLECWSDEFCLGGEE